MACLSLYIMLVWTPKRGYYTLFYLETVGVNSCQTSTRAFFPSSSWDKHSSEGLSVITAKDNLVCQWRRLGLKDRKYGNIQTWFPFQCKFNSCKTNDTLESIPVSFLFPNVFSLKPYLPSENIIWTEPKWPQAILVLHRSKYPHTPCQYLPGSRWAVIHQAWFNTWCMWWPNWCFFLQRAERIVLYPSDMPQTAISMLLLSKVNKCLPPHHPPPDDPSRDRGKTLSESKPADTKSFRASFLKVALWVLSPKGGGELRFASNTLLWALNDTELFF